MLNEQMNEIKIRKIQEYEENLVEGEILKMQINRDLIKEREEKENLQKKILEQKKEDETNSGLFLTKVGRSELDKIASGLMKK